MCFFNYYSIRTQNEQEQFSIEGFESSNRLRARTESESKFNSKDPFFNLFQAAEKFTDQDDQIFL